jgi:lipopolysaccharide assembly outer membrane protein LptD (OstA)
MKFLYQIIFLLMLIQNHNLFSVELPDNVDFKAKNIDYNFKDNLVLITGDATFSSNGSILKADSIYYDTKNQLVYATGNVYFKDKDGNEFYPKEIQGDQKLQNIQIYNIDGNLKDRSLIKAQSFEKNTNTEYEIYDVCYTSCQSNGLFTPIWQVTSSKGIYDTEKEKVSLYGAWIEVMNLPILWSPYLSFSNFKKIREAGFLYPRYSINSTLGSILEIPFYIPIGQSQQIIIRNYLYSNLGQQQDIEEINYGSYLPRLEYNGYVDNGDFDVDASLYKEDWHMYLKFNKEFNEIWRSKLSIEKTSGIDYVNLHEINPTDTEDPYLNSYLINELFLNTNNYIALNVYSYDDISPIADINNYNDELLSEYQYFSPNYEWGSINVISSLNNFKNIQSNIYTKINLGVNYNYKYLSTWGNYYINIDNVGSFSSKNESNHTIQEKQDDFFAYNSIGLSYEYPTNYFFKNALITISPRIHFTINSILDENNNPDIIDNNNDYTTSNNLFENSQYQNFEYLNPNDSLAYGLILSGKLNSSNASIFAGQQLEIADSFYTDSTNFNDSKQPSNYFFAINLSPLKYIYVNYESVFLPQFKQEKSSSTIGFNTSLFKFSTSYTSNINNPISELTFNSQLNLNSNLILNMDTLYNVSYTDSTQLKTLNASLTWFNECIYLQGYINQSYYQNFIDNSYGVKILIKGVGDSDLKIL